MAVSFLPISLFMILRWVFPVLGVIVLFASLSWLLKLRISRSTLKAACKDFAGMRDLPLCEGLISLSFRGNRNSPVA